jgi:hypothetical protein
MIGCSRCKRRFEWCILVIVKFEENKKTRRFYKVLCQECAEFLIPKMIPYDRIFELEMYQVISGSRDVLVPINPFTAKRVKEYLL